MKLRFFNLPHSAWMAGYNKKLGKECILVEDLRARTEKRIKELEKEESKQTNQTLKLKVGGAIREDEMLLASLQPSM